MPSQSATSPVTVMLIGAGRMGQMHVQALSTMGQRFRVTSIVDTDTDASQRAADFLTSAGHPSPSLHTDVHAALNLDKAQACVVATPTPSHRGIVADALHSDRHVFCEKPLTFDVETSLILGELAQERGLILAIGFYHRYCTAYLDAQALLDSNDPGAVALIRATQGDAAPPNAATAEDLDNLSIEPRLETAFAAINLSRNREEVDDVLTEILTTRGVKFIETIPRLSPAVASEERGRKATADTDILGRGVAGELQAFADAVIGGSANGLATAVHSARALQIGRIVTESAQSGATKPVW